MRNRDSVSWVKEFMDVHKALKTERSWFDGCDDKPLWNTVIELDYESKKFIGKGTALTKRQSRQIASEAIKTILQHEFRASSIWRK